MLKKGKESSRRKDKWQAGAMINPTLPAQTGSGTEAGRGETHIGLYRKSSDQGWEKKIRLRRNQGDSKGRPPSPWERPESGEKEYNFLAQDGSDAPNAKRGNFLRCRSLKYSLRFDNNFYRRAAFHDEGKALSRLLQGQTVGYQLPYGHPSAPDQFYRN